MSGQVQFNFDPMVPWAPGRKIGHVVDPETGCWLWTGALVRGYGRVGIPATRRTMPAHRYYWERVNGPVPDGLEMDHLCRVRACVNPDHLEPVTRSENMRRSPLISTIPDEDVRAIRRASGTCREIGLRFGVAPITVSSIKSRKRRASVT